MAKAQRTQRSIHREKITVFAVVKGLNHNVHEGISQNAQRCELCACFEVFVVIRVGWCNHSVHSEGTTDTELWAL